MNSELKLNQFALPLSFKANLICLFSLIPFIIVYFFYKNTWLGEGILWVPAIILYLFLRLKFVFKEHKNINPIIFSEFGLFIPGSLVKDNSDVNLKYSEIKEIEFKKMRKKFGGNFIDRVLIYDIYNRIFKIGMFSVDLKKFEKNCLELKLNTKYGFEPLETIILGFILVVSILVIFYIFLL